MQIDDDLSPPARHQPAPTPPVNNTPTPASDSHTLQAIMMELRGIREEGLENRRRTDQLAQQFSKLSAPALPPGSGMHQPMGFASAPNSPFSGNTSFPAANQSNLGNVFGHGGVPNQPTKSLDVHTELLRQLDKPSYEGKPGTTRNFIGHCSNYFAAYGLNDSASKIRWLGTFLKQTARDWWTNITNGDREYPWADYEALELDIIRHFEGGVTSKSPLELLTVKQGTQSVSIYTTQYEMRLRETEEIGHKDELLPRMLFYVGLNHDIKMQMLARDQSFLHNSFDQVARWAMNAETLLSSMKTYGGKSKSPATSNSDVHAHDNRNRVSTYNPRVDKMDTSAASRPAIQCHRCGGHGHYANSCGTPKEASQPAGAKKETQAKYRASTVASDEYEPDDNDEGNLVVASDDESSGNGSGRLDRQ